MFDIEFALEFITNEPTIQPQFSSAKYLTLISHMYFLAFSWAKKAASILDI